tara:strand:- start:284 stop:544 length:261 start_codon:yes stop_codon:yes gene_type:complete
MILRQQGSNQTELSLNNGDSIFFSYETPVAGYAKGFGYFKTSTWYSSTTTRHINKYFKHIDKANIKEVPDSFIVERCNSDILQGVA